MSTGLINKFKQDCRSHGLALAMAAVLRWLVNRLKELIGFGDQIQKRRLQLSAMLNERFSATVRYGPFKGLQLSREIWWGKTDRWLICSEGRRAMPHWYVMMPQEGC